MTKQEKDRERHGENDDRHEERRQRREQGSERIETADCAERREREEFCGRIFFSQRRGCNSSIFVLAPLKKGHDRDRPMTLGHQRLVTLNIVHSIGSSYEAPLKIGRALGDSLAEL